MAKILVIDDEKEILKLIENALRTEHDTVCKERFSEAEMSALTRYDLIILDVMMPDEDGFAVCARIRDLVDCPILFLTAKSTDEDVAYGLSIGADDYIRKPFSVTELRARVNAHLRRERREKSNALERSGVRFFPSARQVFASDREITLTKSEFDIALFLARNPGQTFSKEHIYEQVFGYDKDGYDSAITEHIKNIRRKFADCNINPVETVWGIGYKWKS